MALRLFMYIRNKPETDWADWVKPLINDYCDIRAWTSNNMRC